MPDKDKHSLPTAGELAKFDWWSVVMFAARCARRVQPLYHAMWPAAGVGYGFSLEQAIRIAQNKDASDDADDDAADAAAYASSAAADAAHAAHAAYASYAAHASSAAADAARDAAHAAAAADATHAARAAADAADAARADGRTQLSRLIANDFSKLKSVSFAAKDLPRSKTQFGPLWGMISTNMLPTFEIADADRSTLARLVKHCGVVASVGFTTRCLQRVHYLADLDPTADTTGIVFATWQGENAAWRNRTISSDRFRQRRSFGTQPRPSEVSPRRRATADAVERAAVATLQVLNHAGSESDWLTPISLVLEEAITAANLADEVAHEEAGEAGHAHKQSFLAGMWDDLIQLATAREMPFRGFGPGKDYRPLWAFHKTTDLADKITDLRKQFAPPPAPLILLRTPAVTEDEQRAVESLALQLLGTEDAVRAWFKLKLPDLGRKTPLQVLQSGNFGLLEFHLQSALSGDFG